jgi:hypothetical protein
MPSLFFRQPETTSSPYINRFLQPDSIIPDLSNPQSWNRFSYVQNNPIGYNDPTGHQRTEGGDTHTPDPGDYCDTHPNACGAGGDGDSGNGDPDLDLQLSPDFEFTCSGCPQSMPDDYYLSFIPFSTSDVCYLLLNNQMICTHDFPPNPLSVSNVSVDYWSFYGSPPYLYQVGNDSQDFATAVDLFYAPIELGFISDGCLAGPEGCLAGMLTGQFVFNITLGNAIESGASFVSLVSTGLADYGDDGSFGEATNTSVFTFLLGGASLDPIVDLIIDGYASGYNDGTFCSVDTIISGQCFP